MISSVAVLALLAGAAVVRAQVNPTAPGPGDKFNEGEDCSFSWDVDTTGKWKTMNVQLMTGDNFHMVHLSTVATLDGTDPSTTTFKYPCPKVEPNSAIYFYQFTSPDDPSPLWATRFTIAAADGSSTPPANDVQPGEGGALIPWGVGALENPADAKPAPAYLAGGAPPPATTTPPGTSTTKPATNQNTPPTAPRNNATAPPAPSQSGAKSALTDNSTLPDPNAAVGLAANGLFVRAALALSVAAATFVVAL